MGEDRSGLGEQRHAGTDTGPDCGTGADGGTNTEADPAFPQHCACGSDAASQENRATPDAEGVRFLRAEGYRRLGFEVCVPPIPEAVQQ